MRLLLYSHFFAPSVGGVESVVLSLARALAEARTKRGINEFDLTLVTETTAEGFDDSALPFRVLRRPGFFELLKTIRASDIIHIAGPSLTPLVLGWLSRKPVVIEHHGFQAICPTGQLLIEPSSTPCPGHFMARRYLKCLRCRSDRNWLASWKLCILTFVRRFLCSHIAANIMPTEWVNQLIRLPNSFPILHGIETVGRDSELRDLPKPPRMIFQGRLVTTKGLPVLLEAASLLRDEGRRFEILVIGDGPERSAMQELAEKLKLSSHVQFAGKIAAPGLDAAFSKVSVVVVPSLGGEVFGMVVAESMSRGLPVVASNLGSFAELLGDAGLLFRVGDAIDLSRQIKRLLDDPEFAFSLGVRAQRRVSNRFSRCHMVEAHAELYRRLSVPQKVDS